jgi:hypothetical protein
MIEPLVFEHHVNDANELQNSSCDDQAACKTTRNHGCNGGGTLSIYAKAVREHDEEAGTDEGRSKNGADKCQDWVRLVAEVLAQEETSKETNDFE